MLSRESIKHLVNPHGILYKIYYIQCHCKRWQTLLWFAVPEMFPKALFFTNQVTFQSWLASWHLNPHLLRGNLEVEPTHLTKICSSNWIISPRFEVKIKKHLKPPRSHTIGWPVGNEGMIFFSLLMMGMKLIPLSLITANTHLKNSLQTKTT